uniref:hypothetical protein n=1 Tax=Campylobacter lanienae TaxID=75658 RepID=UPI0015D7EBF3
PLVLSFLTLPPPTILPVTIAVPLIVTLFSFAMPVPLAQPPARDDSMACYFCVFSRDCYAITTCATSGIREINFSATYIIYTLSTDPSDIMNVLLSAFWFLTLTPLMVCPGVLTMVFSIITLFPVTSGSVTLCQGLIPPLLIVLPLMVHVSPSCVVHGGLAKLAEYKIPIVIDESRNLGLFIFDFLEVVGGGSGICYYSSYIIFHFFSLFSKIWAGLYKKFTYF